MNMNLWVRSQDKECLTNVSNIQYIYKNNMHGLGTYYDNLKILGTYKTKERAIEVLDEIQNLLQPTIEYKPIVQEEYNPSYKYKHFVKVDDNVEIKELSTVVYQMPAEWGD